MQLTETPKPILPEISKAYELIATPGGYTEIRAPKARGGTQGGFYSNPNSLAQDVYKLSTDERTPAIYWTIQEIKKPTTVKNRLERLDSGTGDLDVNRYRWLVVDVDPVRAASFETQSSSDAEKKNAELVAIQIREFFSNQGIESILIDSGNGYHILVPLEISNANGTSSLVKAVLEGLHEKFGTPHASVDTTVSNPARILKIPGTVARKGRHTEERPWRVARILDVPAITNRLDEGQLRRLLSTVSAEATAKLAVPREQVFATDSEVERSLDWLKDFMAFVQIEYTQQKPPREDGLIALPMRCPFASEHESGTSSKDDAFVGVNAEAAKCFSCKHNSCSNKGWHQFRAKAEALRGAKYSGRTPAKLKCAPGYFIDELGLLLEGSVISTKPTFVLGRNGCTVEYTSYTRAHDALCDSLGYEYEGDVDSINAAYRAVSWVKPTTEQQHFDVYNLTQVGNGKRLRTAHGKITRYCNEEKRWLVFNGKTWVWDHSHKLMDSLVKGVVASAQPRGSLDEKEKKRFRKFMLRSESIHNLRGAVECAASEIGAEISKGALDTKRYVCNLNNGTLRWDEKTGAMAFNEEYRIEDYATKLMPVDYNPSTPCPLWEKQLAWMFKEYGAEDQADICKFLQTYFGLSLIGVVPPAVLILWGNGRNGKSTIMSVFAKMMGSQYEDGKVLGSAYFQQSNMATWTITRGDTADKPRSDLVRLAGARLICASEMNKGDSQVMLSTALLKEWTGGEEIVERALNSNDRTPFIPQGLLVFLTNHKPNISDDSDAAWARLKLVPCRSKVSEEDVDTDLNSKLLAEKSGILNWLIQGVANYFQAGKRLITPPAIRDATKEYRGADNPVRSFIEEQCALETGAKASAVALYRRYCGHFTENEQGEPLKQKPFTEELKTILAITDKLPRDHSGSYFTGIRLNEIEEPEYSEHSFRK